MHLHSRKRSVAAQAICLTIWTRGDLEGVFHPIRVWILAAECSWEETEGCNEQVTARLQPQAGGSLFGSGPRLGAVSTGRGLLCRGEGLIYNAAHCERSGFWNWLCGRGSPEPGSRSSRGGNPAWLLCSIWSRSHGRQSCFVRTAGCRMGRGPADRSSGFPVWDIVAGLFKRDLRPRESYDARASMLRHSFRGEKKATGISSSRRAQVVQKLGRRLVPLTRQTGSSGAERPVFLIEGVASRRG
jgi:hypothetical protein